MDARVICAERTLSLLTSTYLANAESVKAYVGTVVDTVLSQNLFEYVGAQGVRTETAKRYDMAVQKWIARVNSLAAGKTPDMRVAGVILMKQTALQGPSILIDNIAKWTATVVGLLSKSDMATVTTAALQTVMVFMDVVREMPIMRREIASSQVPRINQAVLTLAETNPDLAQNAIETLMYSAYWFPTLIRPFSTKTEALCLQILGDHSAKVGTETYKRAAECVAALCTVGGKVAVEDRWFQIVQITLGTIQHCIEHILCVDSLAREATPVQEGFDLPEINGNFIVGMPQAAGRISRMTDLLIALLTRPVDADVPIPADGVVRVASKLALVPMLAKNSKTPRAEHDVVPILAPQLHREAIRMMAALVLALGSNMQPFLGHVARTIGTISTASVASPATTVALYSLVRLCVERFGYGFTVCLPRDVLSSIIGDTHAQSPSAVRIATDATAGLSTPKKRGSGRSQKRGAQLADEQLSRGHLHVQYTDVVRSALGATLAVLDRTPTVLGTELRTQLDSRVLTLLLLEMVGGTDQPHASRQSDAPFRALLCRCLRASVLSPDPWQKAIVPHALAIFTAGLEDSSREVRAVCADALSAVEPIVHARLPAQLRAPDTDENVKAESHVPGLVFGVEAGLSAALADTHLNNPLSARGCIEVPVSEQDKLDAAGGANKRHKHSIYATAASAMDADEPVDQETRPVKDDKGVHSNNQHPSSAETVVKSSTIDTTTTGQPIGNRPSAMTTAFIEKDSSLIVQISSAAAETSSSAGAKRSILVNDNSEDKDDEDDDIPDIVMEGSDSGDEDDDEA